MSSSLKNSGVTAWTLLRKTNPQERPVSLQEAKQTVRLSQSDTSHDNDLREAIDAATEQVEHDTDRAIIDQDFTYYRNSFPANEPMSLPKRPVTAVESIEYLDSDGATQTLSADVYGLDQGRRNVYLLSGQSWPSTLAQTNAVTVTFTAGYGSTRDKVPRLIKRAILIQVGRWFYDPAGENDGGNWVTAYDNIIDRLLATFYTGGD